MAACSALANFKLGKCLGKGSYGAVYKAVDINTKNLVAIKFISKQSLTKKSSDNLIAEIEILKKVSHPHIVSFHDFTWDGKNVYMIMEFCAGGDLSYYLKRHGKLGEMLVQKFFKQLASALLYLNSLHIAHMDLKPQNILTTSIDNPNIKLSDFGFAKALHGSEVMEELRGSYLYMDPIIYQRGFYDPTCDLWSSGVIMFECLFGFPPYYSDSVATVKQKLLEAESIIIPETVQISNICNDLLKRLLETNIRKRLTFEEFARHPFVNIVVSAPNMNLQKAQEALKVAVQLESDGDLVSAFTHYVDGLEYLSLAIRAQCDGVKSAPLLKRADSYMEHVERLKDKLESQSTPLNAFILTAEEAIEKPMRPPPPMAGVSSISSSEEENSERSLVGKYFNLWRNKKFEDKDVPHARTKEIEHLRNVFAQDSVSLVLPVIDGINNFYCHVQLGKLDEALFIIHEQFSHWLEEAKKDTKKERRDLLYSELSNVMDMSEQIKAKQQIHSATDRFRSLSLNARYTKQTYTDHNSCSIS